MKGLLLLIGLAIGAMLFWNSLSVDSVQPSEVIPTFRPVAASESPAPRAFRIGSVVYLRPPSALGNHTLEESYLREALVFVTLFWQRFGDGDVTTINDFAADANVTHIMAFANSDSIADYGLDVYKSAILKPHLLSALAGRARYFYSDVLVGSRGADAWVCTVRTNDRNRLIEDLCYRVGRDRDRWLIKELDWKQNR